MTEAESRPIARVEEARRLLAVARTVDEVKDVRDQAAAAALYAKQRGYTQDIIDYATEIKVRAERKAGELLIEMPKNEGGRPPVAETHSDAESVSSVAETAPRLADIGITPKQSMRWQEMARVPEPVFEEAVREVKAEGRGLTTAAVMRTAEAKVQQDAIETVIDVVPGAEERIARARLRALFSRTVVDLRRNLLAVHPEAIYAALEEDDMVALRAVLADISEWIDAMRRLDSQLIRVVK